MDEHACNPAQHPTWSELKEHCGGHHDAMMEWAKAKIETSHVDREQTKSRVDKLELWKDKMMWAIAIGSIGIIASNILGPMFLTPKSNGTAAIVQQMNEIKGYIGILSETQVEHKKVSEQNTLFLKNVDKEVKDLQRKVGK